MSLRSNLANKSSMTFPPTSSDRARELVDVVWLVALCCGHYADDDDDDDALNNNNA